jgi:hypothetical protein
MRDAIDSRLLPLVRLRDATAELLLEAQRALSAGCPSQDRRSVQAIKRQLASFDRHLKRSRAALSAVPHRH